MAVEILQRYIDMVGDSLFPFISRQKNNEAIKEMLTLAKVNRIITILNPVTRKDEQYPICGHHIYGYICHSGSDRRYRRSHCT